MKSLRAYEAVYYPVNPAKDNQNPLPCGRTRKGRQEPTGWLFRHEALNAGRASFLGGLTGRNQMPIKGSNSNSEGSSSGVTAGNFRGMPRTNSSEGSRGRKRVGEEIR
ncbi:MAG: hypothetical protein D6679_03430 [Candidatus Hydrogenedentota bacterium]|nr:MAG: hypothetical protein D6679_03430 [Candidatus Hydrogenedentota bacterium]